MIQFTLIHVLMFLLVLPIFFTFDLAPINGEPWDLDEPCQAYVEKFAVAQAAMVQCATNFSIPPKVCTNCVVQYMEFKQIEYEMHHLQNVTSRDNRSCTDVIYDNYLLSYSNEISEALSAKIWDNSRCESCIHISWNYDTRDNRFEFLNHTVEFQSLLFDWRDCITNYTSSESLGSLLDLESSNSTICAFCKDQFDQLFKFYWDIYVRPGVDFCVDVETTMNDTFHIWNDVWQCADRKDRNRDSLLVIVTTCIMAGLIALFYASSFIQGGGARRHLVQYSRLGDPRGQRSRLLSTSASETIFSSSSYSGPYREER